MEQLFGEFDQNTIKMRSLQNGIYEIKKLQALKKDGEKYKLIAIDKHMNQIKEILTNLSTLESGGLKELGKVFRETLQNEKEIEELQTKIKIEKEKLSQQEESEQQKNRENKNKVTIDNFNEQLQKLKSQLKSLKEANYSSVENLSQDIADSFVKYTQFENKFKSKFLRKDELHTPQFMENLLAKISREYISFKVKKDLIETMPNNPQLLEIQTQLDFLPLVKNKFIESQEFKINHSQQIGNTGETYEGSYLNKITGSYQECIIKQSQINCSNVLVLYKRLTEFLLVENTNLIKIFGINVIEVSNKKYRVTVIMEKLNSNLYDIIIKQKEAVKVQDKVEVLNQILIGLKQLHKFAVPHRNLKLSNILTNMTLSQFKLSEISIYPDQQSLQEINVLAPLKYHPIDNNPKSVKYDIWQFGLLTYEIITGKLVWNSVQTPLEMEDILKQKTSFFSRNESTGNNQFDQLIDSCLNYDGDSRISLKDLKELLKSFNK